MNTSVILVLHTGGAATAGGAATGATGAAAGAAGAAGALGTVASGLGAIGGNVSTLNCVISGVHHVTVM